MFKFIRTSDAGNPSDRTELEYRVCDNDMSWPDLVEEFMRFLLGCGYTFDAGEFDEAVRTTAEDLQGGVSECKEAE